MKYRRPPHLNQFEGVRASIRLQDSWCIAGNLRVAESNWPGVGQEEKGSLEIRPEGTRFPCEYPGQNSLQNILSGHFRKGSR